MLESRNECAVNSEISQLEYMCIKWMLEISSRLGLNSWSSTYKTNAVTNWALANLLRMRQ